MAEGMTDISRIDGKDYSVNGYSVLGSRSSHIDSLDS
jgi:hypothetical protein